MKKLLYLAAVAATALTSCDHEKDFNDGQSLDKDGIAFSLQSGATRSANAVSSETQGVSIPIATEDGIEFSLVETITDLYSAPETRGTPVYTENVGYLYKDKLGVFAEYGDNQGVDASYYRLQDNLHQYGENNAQKGWIFKHEYDVNIWGNGKEKVQFYLRMPSDMTDHGVNSVASAEGVTTVSYEAPLTAADQEDIIFGAVKLDREEYLGHYKTKGGAPVTLYHALTGVKFAIANTAAEVAKIQINKITFTGLVNKGDFTFNAANPSPTAFTWDPNKLEAVENNVIYQEFEDGDLVTYETGDGNNFADSYYAAGTSQNINDAAATKTFWLIPQTIQNSEGTLRIDYTMDGQEEYMVIELSDLYKGKTWEAGQLRTFTFKLDEVKVKITDTVEMEEASTETIHTRWGDLDITSYKGSTKQDVTITNTGNTDAFIRVALVGQWRDQDGDPVFGFTDYTYGVQLVASWYQDQFVDKTYKQGKFTGLPGDGWELNESDGYYYYKNVVPAGQAIPSANALFESYEVGSAPGAAIAGEVQEIYFTLEIAVQAISAKKLDGTNYTYSEAWARALAME